MLRGPAVRKRSRVNADRPRRRGSVLGTNPTRSRTQLDIGPEVTDYLGHVTAYAHLLLLEQARWSWLADAWGVPEPTFVVARQELDYRREIVVADSPVTVVAAVERISRSSFVVREEIVSGAPEIVHTTSRAVLVRWDTALRCPATLTAAERTALGRFHG